MTDVLNLTFFRQTLKSLRHSILVHLKLMGHILSCKHAGTGHSV